MYYQPRFFYKTQCTSNNNSAHLYLYSLGLLTTTMCLYIIAYHLSLTTKFILGRSRSQEVIFAYTEPQETHQEMR